MLDLQQTSCKGGTEDCHIYLTQFSLLLTSEFTVIHLKYRFHSGDFLLTKSNTSFEQHRIFPNVLFPLLGVAGSRDFRPGQGGRQDRVLHTRALFRAPLTAQLCLWSRSLHSYGHKYLNFYSKFLSPRDKNSKQRHIYSAQGLFKRESEYTFMCECGQPHMERYPF